MVHAAFWSTTRYPSRSSNVCPCASQYGLYEGDTSKSRYKHPGTTGFPLVLVGKVENQQVILRGSFTNLVSTLGRELQMVRGVRMPKNNAIEAVVVVKLGEDRAVQPFGIHLGNGC
jgi:hypothetical protein